MTRFLPVLRRLSPVIFAYQLVRSLPVAKRNPCSKVEPRSKVKGAGAKRRGLKRSGGGSSEVEGTRYKHPAYQL